MAQKTVGFLFGDLQALVQKAVLHNIERFSTVYPKATSLFCKSCKLNFQDFEKSMKHFDEIMAKTIGAPKVPAVNWQDVGKWCQIETTLEFGDDDHSYIRFYIHNEKQCLFFGPK